MEQFRLLEGDRTLKSSREQINNALLTVRSLSSGTTFPTTDLTEGMLCYRTDHGRLYQLADITNEIWTDRIAMSIAGTADTAASVSWTNIENKPTAYPADTHTHLYAGASTAGGPADKAEKLATPRTINGTPFDGTTDITVTVPWSNVEAKPDSYASADKLATPRTINGIPFDGTTDITIAVPPTPKSYVTTTWKNGTSWYRVYSDGWIEQGGIYTHTSTSPYNAVVSFAKAFTTTPLTVIRTHYSDGSSANLGTAQANTYSGIDTISTTQFAFRAIGSGTSKKSMWYACGY